MAVRKLSIVSTQRYTVQLQSSKSYTLQSVDLLWQRIELETLDILTMVHHAIADRVDSHNKLRKAVSLLWQFASAAANASTADTQMLRWNIDSLQLWMTLAVVYFPTSAYLQLV